MGLHHTVHDQGQSVIEIDMKTTTWWEKDIVHHGKQGPTRVVRAVARQLNPISTSLIGSRISDGGLTPCGASLHCSGTFSVQILPPPPVGIFNFANRPELFHVLKQRLTAVSRASHGPTALRRTTASSRLTPVARYARIPLL